MAVACGRPEYEYADNKDVRIEDVKSRPIEGGFLEVTASFRGTSSGLRQTSYYQIHYFDKDGFPTENSSWRSVSIRGTAAVPIRERSTKPGATEFTFKISNKAY